MNETEPIRSGLSDKTIHPPSNGLRAETTLSEENIGNITPNPSVNENMEFTVTASNSNKPPVSVQPSLYVETGITQEHQSQPSTSVRDETRSRDPTHTSLCVEMRNTREQQNLPSSSVRDETHHTGYQTIRSLSVKPINSTDNHILSTVSLHDETCHTMTDIRDASNANFNDKIDTAQGLLLLSTDVSSADDSQKPPEPPELPLSSGLHDETYAKSSDSDKTIVAEPTEVSTPTLNVTSPRKGVLNLRQIGIKRHQPVDSTHPSAIGSPPGSPSTEKPVQNKSASQKKNNAGKKNNQRKNKK